MKRTEKSDSKSLYLKLKMDNYKRAREASEEIYVAKKVITATARQIKQALCPCDTAPEVFISREAR